MTLGDLITELEKYPDFVTVQFDDGSYPGDFSSYRGYYRDLAIEPTGHEWMNVGTLELMARGCVDKAFTGYKGGDFVMDRYTNLWVAEYGSSTSVIPTKLEVVDSRLIIRTCYIGDYA